MRKLNFLGIGPKVAVVLLPWLTLTIVFSIMYNEQFIYTISASDALLVFGILLMIIGLIVYFSTLKLLLNGLKETKLVTTGVYRLCQNPLYSTFVLFLIPD